MLFRSMLCLVREGNLIRIVTSHNKKNWYLVDAASEGVCDRIKAVGNEVQYHSVTMPSSIEGATISGAVTQVVHGMPFNITVVPVSEDDRVTISVNDVIQVADAATGKLSIGSVMEDLNVAIQVNPKGTPVYNVLHVQAGELEAKMAALKQFSRIKLVGTVDYKEFSAIQAKIAAIEALDLADLTIMKNGQPATELPSLGPISVTVRSMLKTVILPMNIKIIGDGAFSRSYNMQEITIPASVTEIKNNAFSTCIKLTKVTSLAMSPENAAEHKWLFDFDKKDGVDDFVSDLEAEGFRKEEIEVYKTVNNYAVVVPHGFDSRNILKKYDCVELKRDGLLCVAWNSIEKED